VNDPSPAAKSFADEPDVKAMLRVQAGDLAAFREIVERWQSPLIHFFYRSLSSQAEAEDLAQQTFLRLYKAAPRYVPSAKLSTFLFHIARRLLLNELRRRARKPAEAVDPESFRRIADDRPDREVSELEVAFSQALEELPENHRSAILLYKQQGLSYREIAVSLGASVGAVKTWIHRARQSLKIALKDYYHEDA
jgi:RNA polymerase sigma-70 factor (ECF subfamily)